MAKNRHRHTRRDAPRIANGLRDRAIADLIGPLPDPIINDPVPAVRSPISVVEDRREWTPDTIRAPRSSRRRNALVHVAKPSRPVTRRGHRPLFLGHTPAFKAPKYVAVCVRRKQRREVLLATGRGGGGKRRPRRNEWSNVKC